MRSSPRNTGHHTCMYIELIGLAADASCQSTQNSKTQVSLLDSPIDIDLGKPWNLVIECKPMIPDHRVWRLFRFPAVIKLLSPSLSRGVYIWSFPPQKTLHVTQYSSFHFMLWARAIGTSDWHCTIVSTSSTILLTRPKGLIQLSLSRCQTPLISQLALMPCIRWRVQLDESSVSTELRAKGK